MPGSMSEGLVLSSKLTWATGALRVSCMPRHNVSSLLAPSSTADSAHCQKARGLRELWESWRGEGEEDQGVEQVDEGRR